MSLLGPRGAWLSSRLAAIERDPELAVMLSTIPGLRSSPTFVATWDEDEPVAVSSPWVAVTERKR